MYFNVLCIMPQRKTCHKMDLRKKKIERSVQHFCILRSPRNKMRSILYILIRKLPANYCPQLYFCDDYNS